MENEDLKVLWIDDEEDNQDAIEYMISKTKYIPIYSSSPENALEIFSNDMPNIVLVLCDYVMPKMTGFDFRKKMLEINETVPFGIVSGQITKDMALEGIALKICGFFDKPFNEELISIMILKESKKRAQSIIENRAIEKTFIEEASGILDEIEPHLLSLNYNRQDISAMKAIARGVHTLKGASSCLSSNILAKYIHKYEDFFSPVLNGKIILTDDIYDILFIGLDRIKELIISIKDKKLHLFKLQELLNDLNYQLNEIQKPPQKNIIEKKQEPLQTQKPKDAISVPIQMLDELSGFSGEITVIRNMINKIIYTLNVKYNNDKDIQSLEELFDEMHKINSTIQNSITDLCKVPLSGIFKPIPRILRDLARDLGKEIQININGENIRVANSLSLVCSNSLIHLIRNSADHGIEMPHERLAIQKPAHGTVNILCSEDNNELQILISDDGRGINPKKIKEKALEKELFSEKVLEAMSDQQIFEIIFSSGFSTAATLTDVSGRGVGMDMVKSSVESVGGQIEIESQINAGTSFKIRLPKPKSVLIIHSLLVKCMDRCFAIPQDNILHVLRIENKNYHTMIQKVASEQVLCYNNTLYPLLDLKKLLNISKCNQELTIDNITEILILQAEKYLFALHVDGILDSEEIVVKRINACFNYKGVYTGATFMGDGSVSLILDIKNLAEYSGIKNFETKVTQKQNEPTLLTEINKKNSSMQDYLLFDLESKTLYGIPINQVFRLEKIEEKKIQYCGAERAIIYRESVMPIYSMEKLLNIHIKKPSTEVNKEHISIIVTHNSEGYMGLEVPHVIDIAAGEKNLLDEIRDRIGVLGNTFINDKTVTILDLPTVIQNSEKYKV
ncbi:chemotaxis protein CheW [Fluviispira multicolorata]|uniref:Chemotaxis protein CheA n=1 Tax=Fluviispira multicolorata TaxID=2654512 RepID=A0A833JC46_9BACT|nr:chemotaxis protein CheW [Fluviispira multicolorata]KAB8029782.1 response regulator [Fluviispira multicolorata]